MRRLSGPRWAALLALLALACCELGPTGPGVLNGTIISPFNLGSVVPEVEGTGVRGSVGNGDTQAYGSVVPRVGGRHRVVLVSRSGSSIPFGIEVEDLRAETPIAIVVFAAGADNIPKLLAGTLVELEH